MIQWQNLSKSDLDHHLSPSAWSNRFKPTEVVNHFVSKTSDESENTRRCTLHERDVPYGEGKMQSIDLYLPKDQTEESPVLIFIHGGYWQATGKEQSGLVAKHPVKHGAITACVGYTLAPLGTLPQMVDDVEQAIVFIAKKYPKSRGFYLSGHSAGAQLAAMMLTVDWAKKYGLAKDFIKGACLISGIFDVRPIVKSYVNDPLHLTEAEAYHASPITSENLSEALRLSPDRKIVNVCGEHDPPLLIMMTKEYTQKLSEHPDGSLEATCHVIPGMGHFELIERLVESEHPVTKILLQTMSL